MDVLIGIGIGIMFCLCDSFENNIWNFTLVVV